MMHIGCQIKNNELHDELSHLPSAAKQVIEELLKALLVIYISYTRLPDVECFCVQIRRGSSPNYLCSEINNVAI